MPLSKTAQWPDLTKHEFSSTIQVVLYHTQVQIHHQAQVPLPHQRHLTRQPTQTCAFSVEKKIVNVKQTIKETHIFLFKDARSIKLERSFLCLIVCSPQCSLSDPTDSVSPGLFITTCLASALPFHKISAHNEWAAATPQLWVTMRQKAYMREHINVGLKQTISWSMPSKNEQHLHLVHMTWDRKTLILPISGESWLKYKHNWHNINNNFRWLRPLFSNSK